MTEVNRISFSKRWAKAPQFQIRDLALLMATVTRPFLLLSLYCVFRHVFERRSADYHKK
jgi:hypothetical protein